MSLKNKDRVSKGHIVDEMHRFNIILESREIFLHSHIEGADDEGVDHRVCNHFLKNIKLLENIDTKPIIVHQHSIGGSYLDGMMIYDAIANSPCHIIMVTHGVAASMGSIIPQAADVVVTMPNCWWMIHEGTISNNEGSPRKQAKSLIELDDKFWDQMLDIYTVSFRKSNMFKDKSDAQIRNYINKQVDKKQDWWLSGNEAVEHGLANAVYGSYRFESLDEIIKNVF